MGRGWMFFAYEKKINYWHKSEDHNTFSFILSTTSAVWFLYSIRLSLIWSLPRNLILVNRIVIDRTLASTWNPVQWEVLLPTYISAVALRIHPLTLAKEEDKQLPLWWSNKTHLFINFSRSYIVQWGRIIMPNTK